MIKLKWWESLVKGIKYTLFPKVKWSSSNRCLKYNADVIAKSKIPPYTHYVFFENGFSETLTIFRSSNG
jgi:hypothetical protein